jgi:hypothetical protein
MPMHAHFVLPWSTQGLTYSEYGTTDTWVRYMLRPRKLVVGSCGLLEQFDLLSVDEGSALIGQARSAPLSLSGRAHITAVTMWSCLPLHIFVETFSFLLLTNFVPCLILGQQE